MEADKKHTRRVLTLCLVVVLLVFGFPTAVFVSQNGGIDEQEKCSEQFAKTSGGLGDFVKSGAELCGLQLVALQKIADQFHPTRGELDKLIDLSIPNESTVCSTTGSTLTLQLPEASPIGAGQYITIEKPPTRTLSGKKVIALSFDDGPTAEVTPVVLDVLKEEGVKATFFELGQAVNAYPYISKRVVEEGHTLGSHSFLHRSITRQPLGDVSYSWRETLLDIYDATGKVITTFRPPHGFSSAESVSRIKGEIVNFGPSADDWIGLSGDEVTAKVVNTATNGSIILLHDSQRVEMWALKNTIEQLKEKGFEFVTVDEIIQHQSGFPIAFYQLNDVNTFNITPESTISERVGNSAMTFLYQIGAKEYSEATG
ncbi:MAG: polysaccharide deacetylase family protein [Candidatus Ancillula sp.]|jgi:peptidoglycan/xylan/chitin deacetylase (PgdA/CDA1 family)|nr:polysaccharide deacetylase family protein [Candidatus Ancillula sp.]